MRNLTLDKLPKKVLARLDLETAFKASRCVLAAEKLLVFRKLDGKSLSAVQVSKQTGITRKYCEPFLDFLVSLGLLVKRNNRYHNSRLATRHFIEARSADWTRFWSSECIKDFEALSVMESVLTGDEKWQEVLGKERKTDYELVREDRQWARDFTYALYDLYQPSARLLAEHLDLSKYRSLLDVGGGSGVMSMALVRANSCLKACILDFPFVCDAAREIIRKERLSRRITTLAGDMNDGIPEGYDVIMFWNIGYVDHKVVDSAYTSLPDGGMVVRDCVVRSESAGVSPSAFFHEYYSVRPKQQTKSSMVDSLRAAGFKSVKYRRLSREIGLITGIKGTTRA